MDELFNILYELNISCYDDMYDIHSVIVSCDEYYNVHHNNTISINNIKNFNLIESLKKCSYITGISFHKDCGVDYTNVNINFITDKFFKYIIETDYQFYKRKRNIEKL